MPVRIIPPLNYTSRQYPTTDELEVGELVLNAADGILYTKLASGEISTVPPGAAAAPNVASTFAAASMDTGITLDEQIERGAWLPYAMTVNAGTTAAIQPTVTYNDSLRYGAYTKIGQTVVVYGRLVCTVTAGQGRFVIGGLPFSRASSPQGPKNAGLLSVSTAKLASGPPPRVLAMTGVREILPQALVTETASGLQYVTVRNYAASDLIAGGEFDVVFGGVYETME